MARKTEVKPTTEYTKADIEDFAVVAYGEVMERVKARGGAKGPFGDDVVMHQDGFKSGYFYGWKAAVAALEARLKAAEKSESQLIDERDDAEQALSQAYYLVIGESPEWSNLFGHEQALEEIKDAVSVLKQSAKQRPRK